MGHRGMGRRRRHGYTRKRHTLHVAPDKKALVIQEHLLWEQFTKARADHEKNPTPESRRYKETLYNQLTEIQRLLHAMH